MPSRLRSNLVPLLLLLAAGACSTDSASRQSARTPDGIDQPFGAMVRLADEARARGDTPTAIAFYRHAVETSPEASLPLIRLGSALMESGAYEQAAASYKMALTRDGKSRDALIGLGASLIALNRPSEAIQPLEQVRVLDPGNARVYRDLGVAYDLLGRSEEARGTYEAGLAKAPDDNDLRSDLALSLVLAGQGDGAVKMMREVAASPLAQPRHLRNLVLVLGLSGRDEEAKNLADRALRPTEANLLMARIKKLQEMQQGPVQAAALGTVVGQ